MGNTNEALKSVESLESSQGLSASQENWAIAPIYVALGDDDEAFRRLANSRPYTINLKRRRFLAPLRDDPRYHEELRRLGLEP